MLSEAIIVTNISRSSPHTTSWFAAVRHQHLKTNLQGLLPRVHILIVSISNLKLPVFGLFCVLSTLWSLKYPHPKSQQTPRVSTKLEMVVNLSYSFIPLQKILQKGVDHLVENPRKGAENLKMTPNAPNKFYRRMRRRDAPLPRAEPPIITERKYEEQTNSRVKWF